VTQRAQPCAERCDNAGITSFLGKKLSRKSCFPELQILLSMAAHKLNSPPSDLVSTLELALALLLLMLLARRMNG